ncbi:hypothetical protein D0864_05271 [Hortaea werneckii]|uniref:Uncharacterized protein n=1 Tax=Hortaea werneckii TaxID=91943 RepID=A0A3M7G576_HORWE|nr:hypothetical protein D0864_05271 [Hortaea werneckii]
MVVEISLPPSCATQFASDPATRCFLRRLEGKITGSSSSSSSLSSSSAAATGLDDLMGDGKVVRNLETARFAYEAFVFGIKFGGKGEEVALLGEGDWEAEKGQEGAVGEEEEEKEEKEEEKEKGEDGEVSGEDWPAKRQWVKKTKKEKRGGKKKKSKKGKNSKGKRWVGDRADDDEEDDGEEMQWALQQSLEQVAGEEEKELKQAIRESLGHDAEESPESARIGDRDRRYHRGASEIWKETKFGGDEYDMGLSEDMDEFSLDDFEDDEALSEDMREDDSQDGESHEGDRTITKETASEPKEHDTAALSEDTTATDPDDDDDEGYWHGHYEATEESRAKARELRARRKGKKNSQPRLPLTEPLSITAPTDIDVWQVTGTTSIISSTTFPEGARFGQPVAATRAGPFVDVVEDGPGERMGPHAVETGWGEEAVSMLERTTPEFIAETAGTASDGVASGNSDSPGVVLESGFDV